MAGLEGTGVEGLYQMKVDLVGSKPPIWRRFLVPGDVSLRYLHSVLQAVMGWQNCHIHFFRIGDSVYGEADLDPDPGTLDDKAATLREVAGREETRFFYQYDFGDPWIHELLVETILEPAEVPGAPVCLAGEGACPPEGCGGIGGYRRFLEAIRDPKHPQHLDCTSWIGLPFDPARFQIEKVNEVLKVLPVPDGAAARR